MLLTDPAYVHMCPDTAHIIVAGSDPLAVVDRPAIDLVVAASSIQGIVAAQAADQKALDRHHQELAEGARRRGDPFLAGASGARVSLGKD